MSKTTGVFSWEGEDAEWWVSRKIIVFVGEGEDAEW